jgi:hypothetical protein
MKKKLRNIIALLRSRAYLDSREAAERKHPPRDDSHHEYERGQNEPFQPAISEHQNNAGPRFRPNGPTAVGELLR